jgi:broad specificity phosphatase PhoE
MSNRFVLVRHATCAQMADRLLGRTLDAPLDEHGCHQAQALARTLASGGGGVRVQSSPRQRTRQTASFIAQHAVGTDIEIAPALDELDFGTWSGRSFEQLAGDAHWRRWNEQRDRCCTPAGESMASVQRRVLEHLRSIMHTDDRIVILVTHAEVIRAVVLHGLGLRAAEYWRIDIGPASLTVVHLEERGMRFECINQRVQPCTW